MLILKSNGDKMNICGSCGKPIPRSREVCEECSESPLDLPIVQGYDDNNGHKEEEFFVDEDAQKEE
jgi:predicted amidophosphoribosyltransferase